VSGSNRVRVFPAGKKLSSTCVPGHRPPRRRGGVPPARRRAGAAPQERAMNPPPDARCGHAAHVLRLAGQRRRRADRRGHALAAKDPTPPRPSCRRADATCRPTGASAALFASGRKVKRCAAVRGPDCPDGDALTADLRRIVAARRRIDEIDPEGRALATLPRPRRCRDARERQLYRRTSRTAAGIAAQVGPEHERAAAAATRLKGQRRERCSTGNRSPGLGDAKASRPSSATRPPSRATSTSSSRPGSSRRTDPTRTSP
jgi:hypothetical protein